MVRTKKWHTRSRCSYHILTSSVIYYWIRRTATWNLFVLYNNGEPFLLFFIYFLPRLCPAFAQEKAIWRDLWSFQNEAISLVAMRSKESWLVEKNRATVKPDSSIAPRWMKTYSESRIELRNLQILKKMLEKSRQFFNRSSPVSRKAWMLPWILQEQARIQDFEMGGEFL